MKQKVNILYCLTLLEYFIDEHNKIFTDLLTSTHHKHVFETTVNKLRSILLQHSMNMDVLRKVSVIKSKISEIESMEPVTLHSGNVAAIKILSKTLRSPLQILEKVRILRQKYLQQRSNRSGKKRSLSKTYEIKNAVKVRKLKVNNLLYQGDVIEGKPFFFFNDEHFK